MREVRARRPRRSELLRHLLLDRGLARLQRWWSLLGGGTAAIPLPPLNPATSTETDWRDDKAKAWVPVAVADIREGEIVRGVTTGKWCRCIGNAPGFGIQAFTRYERLVEPQPD